MQELQESKFKNEQREARYAIGRRGSPAVPLVLTVLLVSQRSFATCSKGFNRGFASHEGSPALLLWPFAGLTSESPSMPVPRA